MNNFVKSYFDYTPPTPKNQPSSNFSNWSWARPPATPLLKKNKAIIRPIFEN